MRLFQNCGLTPSYLAHLGQLAAKASSFAQRRGIFLDDRFGALHILQPVLSGDADAFFTCGSNRLMQLMKRLGRQHGIPGQVAMEQVMACGLGPCYVCVRTFEVNGRKELRRVCIEGPVFDLQEAIGW